MLRTAARRACLGCRAVDPAARLRLRRDSEPEPLKAMEPEVPADLCATVPEAAKAGLVANSNTDTTGDPDRRVLAALLPRRQECRCARWSRGCRSTTT